MLSQLGHYRDLEKIGQGGMGVVYKAEDTRLGRSVALKVLPSLMNTDRARRSRFLREARAAAKLNHPNIATVFEAGEVPDETGLSDSGILYIAMEYVEGEDLSSRLARGALTLGDSVTYGIQIAEALEVAHRSGVVHRDLKPHNIRVHPDGRIKILDFGLAKVLQEEPVSDESLLLTRDGFIVGTVPYMAPEQVQGTGADSRSDLFAFGVVLYEMITGRQPFASGNLVDFIRSLTSSDPDPLSYSNAEVSPELEHIVDKLLERQVEERYQSATEVCRDLKAVSGSMEKAPLSGLETRRPSLTKRLSKLSGKLFDRRQLAGLAIVLLTLAGLGWAVTRWLDRPSASGTVRLTISPFIESGAAAGACGGLDQELAGLLINEPGIAVVSGEQAKASKPQVVLRGECRQGETKSLILTLVEGRSNQVLWGHQVSFPQEEDQVAELAYQVARAIETTQALGRSPLRTGFSENDLKALNLFNDGLRELEDSGSTQDMSRAVEILEEAVRLAPNVARFRAELNLAYWWRFVRDKVAEDGERAEAEADRAIELDPDLPEARIARARILRGRGQYEEATSELLLVKERPRGRDLVHSELGLTSENAFDFERARYHYEMAVRLRPGYWRHRNQLGTLLMKLGERGEARVHLEAAVRLAPSKVVTPRVNLSLLEYSEEHLEKAIELLESIPLLPPSSMSNLGNFYFEAGRFAEAEARFAQAVQFEPQNYVYWGNLGDARAVLGNTAGAESAFAKALELVDTQLSSGGPYQDELRAFKAKYQAKLGQCEAALGEVEALYDLIAEKDDSANTLLRLAQTSALCESRRLALKLLQQARQIGLAASTLGSNEFTWLAGDPEFEALRQEPSPPQ